MFYCVFVSYMHAFSVALIILFYDDVDDLKQN